MKKILFQILKTKHRKNCYTERSRSVIFFVLPFFFFGCFDMDNSLFNNSSLSSYALRTTVIPESSRTQIVLQSQGKKIYGYFVQSNGAHPEIVVLYHHGNRDHLQFYWDRAELLYRMGFNLFIYDYQGYGMSEGTPSEAGVYSDATAAYQFVRSKGFEDSMIVNYGFSLGGAPATHVAANVFTPRVHITEAAFASASALTQSGTLLDLPSSFVMNGEYNNAEKIKKIHSPVLIFHGIEDKFIDLEKNGQVLFSNANNPKTFIKVKGAGHSDVPSKYGETKYINKIVDFVLNKK